MKVRTPARSSRSIFWDRFARVGVQGYSQATSRGVAQYEFGKGRGRGTWFPERNGMVDKETDSREQDMIV